jgi:hypothetical protein
MTIMINKTIFRSLLFLFTLLSLSADEAANYKGKWVEGTGDKRKLELIDQAFESMQVSEQMTGLAMLYKRDWDGLVEGPTWTRWWIQNSFGPSYSMMPFLGEPYATWLEHSQGLWFRLMADGKRKDHRGFVGPDGSLCDAANIDLNGGHDLGFSGNKPVADGSIAREFVVYRQGDSGSADAYLGGTAAGLIMESERLLIQHDSIQAKKRLPQLKRVAAFLDTRRDPRTNMMRAGNASNLLAPSFGSYGGKDIAKMSYLVELSVNYTAGLIRLAEVCDMVGDSSEAKKYRQIASKIKATFPALMDKKGSFIMAIDPDGTRHGVFGAEKHGYFEATPNHDAVTMGVVDDATSKRIIQRMLSIPELAPYKLILPNYPSYDEISTAGIKAYGTWVNGGHWTTTQGRMNIACMRVNEFEHPFDSWEKIKDMMQAFRAGSPMTQRGQKNWFNKADYNIIYDCWGAPGGLLRGLFEYDYRANSLRIRPHIPSTISSYIQKQPALFGKTKIYLTVTGNGAVKSAKVNGKAWKIERDGWINLKNLTGNSANLSVEIVCGNAKSRGAWKPGLRKPLVIPDDLTIWELAPSEVNKFHVDLKKVSLFYKEMIKANLQDTYEAEMARTSLELVIARHERRKMLKSGKLIVPDLSPMIPLCNEKGVDKLYLDSARKIAGGLVDKMAGRALLKEPSAPEIVKIAHQVDLFPPLRSADYLPSDKYPLRIGADQLRRSAFSGQMASLRLYGHALSTEEIVQLAKTKPDEMKNTYKPTRQWIFGNFNDNICIDSENKSIAGSHGKVAKKKADNIPCLEFDGGFLDVQDAGFRPNKDFAIEAWLRSPSGIPSGRIVDRVTPGGKDGFLVDIYRGKIRFIVGRQIESVKWKGKANEWVHVTAKFKDKKLMLYINGENQ